MPKKKRAKKSSAPKKPAKEENAQVQSATITNRKITDEMRKSYLDYAMSVIVSRALPDVRDGLKPVHRRILWDMWDSGLTHSAKFRKSANTVGQVLGRYHPHGDVAVYDAMVRLAQDFSVRYTLVDGQGNFGSIDGDSPAAMRYTEARLSKISEELLLDIEKETVDWAPNYDATRNEPKVLPARLPNLLLNGATGIAVGMATSIPPHNLEEVADAILYITENKNPTDKEISEIVRGPDFPTGGIIYDSKSIEEAYATGRGSVTTRAKAEIEEQKRGMFRIVITEIPYQVNKSDLVKNIAELVQSKKIEGIKDLRDESDREGMRIVIELKSGAIPQKVLNQLFKHTNLQKDFYFNMIALVGGIEPRLLSVREILLEYVEYRKKVIRRRTEFELARAEERAHILQGLVKALDSIDKIISAIKKSKDRDDARKNLMGKFKFTEIQSNAILEMRLQTLASLERKKLGNELNEKKKLINDLKLILNSPAKLLEILKKEVRELKENFGDSRRTAIVSSPPEIMREEDLVPNEKTMITLSEGGYIKRLSPSAFSSQKRGGKGLVGSALGEEDFITHFVRAQTHDNILFFSEDGKVYQTKAYEIPAATRTAKGRAIHNFLELPTDQKIAAIVIYGKNTNQNSFLVMATRDGIVKKTSISDFQNIRRTGIKAISLRGGDELIGVRLSDGKDEIIMTTKRGQAIRFPESQSRPMGRSATGIKGIRLAKNDAVAGFDIISKTPNNARLPARQEQRTSDSKLLVVMEKGYGKQTPLTEYKSQNRGGSGIKTANVTNKTGNVIAMRVIVDEKDVFALSAKGQMIRTELKTVRTAGRATQGVRIMNVGQNDKLAAIVVI